MTRSANRLPFFQRPADYRAFLAVLASGLARHPVRLVAYCLLADRFHLIVGPTTPAQVSRLMHWVATTHATGGLDGTKAASLGWIDEGSFTATVLRADLELVHLCRAVERHAVRAGLVHRAQDWPWCSLAERLRPTQTVPLVTTPFLERDAWINYVNTAPASGGRRRDENFAIGDLRAS